MFQRATGEMSAAQPSSNDFPAFLPDLIREASIPERVAQIALATPDTLALRASGSAMSYGQLNERASRLAGYLRSLDLAPEFLAGICLERSFAEGGYEPTDSFCAPGSEHILRRAIVDVMALR